MSQCNNARRKRKTKYQGSGKSLKKYSTRGYSDSAKDSSKKGKIYSLYITDLVSRDNFYSVADAIQEITGWTGMKAKDCCSDAYRGISTFIASTENKDQAENWKRRLESAGAKASIKES